MRLPINHTRSSTATSSLCVCMKDLNVMSGRIGSLDEGGDAGRGTGGGGGGRPCPIGGGPLPLGPGPGGEPDRGNPPRCGGDGGLASADDALYPIGGPEGPGGARSRSIHPFKLEEKVFEYVASEHI